MTEKVIKIAVEGKATVPIDDLTGFQGDLKSLDKENYEKFRKGVIDHGFSFAVHIWKDQGKNYIIDGHQRIFGLKQMRENEGWNIPPIPVNIVQADSYEQAKKKVLLGASVYGRVNEDALFAYMTENNIDIDTLLSSADFAEIDMTKFAEDFFDLEKIDPIATIDQAMAPEMRSASDSVRQVQLFFGSETHVEFMNKVKDLGEIYDTDNATDTVMECIREAHKLIKSVT